MKLWHMCVGINEVTTFISLISNKSGTISLLRLDTSKAYVIPLFFQYFVCMAFYWYFREGNKLSILYFICLARNSVRRL
jgi:hypothetical protein